MGILCGSVRGQQEVAYLILCNAVSRKLDILCGSLKGSSGSGVLNCMCCCVLVVGHFV